MRRPHDHVGHMRFDDTEAHCDACGAWWVLEPGRGWRLVNPGRDI